jgi:hypothetical protein
MTAAAEDVYFANMGTITVTGPGGTPAVRTIAIAKDIEATFESEIATAYGFGSALIQARAKYNHKVTVKIGWLKFAPKVGEWFPFWITDPTSGGGTVVDTNTVALFSVVATFVPLTSTNTSLIRTITSVSFPKFPMKATENQWVKMDLEGSGFTMTDSNV